jgi:TonB family protein
MGNRASRRIKRTFKTGSGNPLFSAVIVSVLIHALALTSVFLIKGGSEKPKVVEIFNVTLAAQPGPKGGGGTSPEAVKPPEKKPKQEEEKVRIAKKQVEKKAEPARKIEPDLPEVKNEQPKAPQGPGQGPVGGGGSKPGLVAGPAVEGGVEFPYGWYLTALKMSVERNWEPSALPMYGSPKTVITFYIDRQGRVSHAKIDQGSGSELYDQKALIAVKKVTGLQPLPAGFRGDVLIVHYTFIPEKS